MKWLEIIKQLGQSSNSSEERELLGGYYDRLRAMVRKDFTDDEIEHRFCLMITCYILRYVSKRVDYSKTNAEYYLTFLKSRLNVEVPV